MVNNMTEAVHHLQSKSLLLPLSAKIKLPGKSRDVGEYWQVQHTNDNVKALREAGIAAPAAILSWEFPKLKGKYEPYAAQKLMAAHLIDNHRSFNLSEMGVGKTTATLHGVEWMMQQGEVRRCLIISPLSTLSHVWASEIFNLLRHRTYAIVKGSSAKRRELLSQPYDFYIINHDGVKTVMQELYDHPEIDQIVVDEASVYRTAGTGLWKSLKGILRDRRLVMLTGTPCPRSPENAWALSKLVDPTKAPKYITNWRNEVLYNSQPNSPFPKWLPRPDSAEKVFKILQPAIRFEKSEVLDLKLQTFVQYDCDLSEEQSKMYKSMKSRMQADFDSGEGIDATNAAHKVTILRQILSGCIKIGEDEYKTIDCSPKLKVLRDIIEEASHKVLVFVPFKGSQRMITDFISTFASVEMVNGDVSSNKRSDIFHAFQNTDSPKVLCLHPRVASHGLTLTAATTTIWFSPISSTDQFLQANARTDRGGQEHPTTIIKLVNHRLEEKIFEELENQRDLQQNVLDMYRDFVSK